MPGPTALSEGRVEPDGDAGEPVDPYDGDDDADAPAPPTIFGAIGQLGAAILVVAVLIALFIGGSALLRRLLG